MRINVVVDTEKWILGRFAREIADRVEDVSISTAYSSDADLNHYMFWHPLLKETYPSPLTMLFTHLNRPYVYWSRGARNAARKCKKVVCISQDSADRLRGLSADPSKIVMIYPGLDEEFVPKRLVVGIVGRTYSMGRKGEGVLEELAWLMDVCPFHFVFIGSGWKRTASVLHLAGAAVTYHEDYPYEQYPDQIRGFDFLLSPGFDEAGPMSVVEAVASGVPVISRETGYAKELDCNLFFDSVHDLVEILTDALDASGPRVDLSMFSWDIWASRHKEMWEGILARSPSTPGHRMDIEPVREGTEGENQGG
jgi:glycosyltransferase involved in cell wall biosynthesis